MTIEKQCTECHRTYVIDVPPDDYKQWQDGALIQNVMPYLSEDQRELFISGICGECFDALFTDEEDEFLFVGLPH